MPEKGSTLMGQPNKRGSDDWCRFYTGIPTVRCSAGVAYANVKDTTQKPYRWICTDPDAAVPCRLCSRYTQEEIDAKHKAQDELVALLIKAMVDIRKETKGKRGITGVIPCPKCGGTLNFTVSSYNGHVHGRCQTEGCLAWAQ